MTDFFDMMGDYEAPNSQYTNQNYDPYGEMNAEYNQTPESAQGTWGVSREENKITQIFNEMPEQADRRNKMYLLEEQRKAKSRQNEEEERVLKTRNQEIAKLFLKNFNDQRFQELEYRKKQNRQKQELLKQNRKNHNEYKNSWDQIAQNIQQQDNKNDKSKMLQAILNKKADFSK